MEYGANVWDPPLEKDIYKLEQIHRRAARFIKNDFRSKTPGCMTTKMLKDLDLPSLQSRRKEKRLIFLFNIQNGTVPAIPKDDFLKPIKPKRQIRARTFTDCVSTNFVQRHQNLNSNCYELPKAYSGAYRHSFFPRTISEWNQLPDQVVNAPSVEAFKNRLYRF